MKKTILSKRNVNVRAAMAETSLREANDAAGFGPNYIYQISYSDGVVLSTVNRLAAALGCSALDLLEEVEVDEDTRPEAPAAAPVAAYA